VADDDVATAAWAPAAGVTALRFGVTAGPEHPSIASKNSSLPGMASDSIFLHPRVA
jgi:hypothetical protein